jgi:phosphohistidine phosphatase
MTRRTLVILRHAKSEQSSTVPDVDRSLTDRGHADAGAAGAWLARTGYLPDAVLCSPARRTRQTWHDVAMALVDAASRPAGPEVSYERAIYDGDVDDLVALVRGLGPGVGTALLVGHNPVLSDLSAALDPSARADSDGLRTAGVAVHVLDGDWAQAGPGAMRRVDSATARA